MSETTVTTYEFSSPDGSRHTFSMTLRRSTLDLLAEPNLDEPDWTRLSFHQCPNCPLDPREHPRCPVATNLVPVCEAFRDRVSFDKVDVVVRVKARSYSKTCAFQEGVSSLMGLIMATSGCPHLDKLRPMVFTHLPFSSAKETTYRAVTMYLLAQFFRQKHARTPDWQLKDLVRTYDDIHVVNVALAKRLAHIAEEDANLNAIVKLDCQADITSVSITQEWWDEIEHIFRPFFDDTPDGSAIAQHPAEHARRTIAAG